jgi:hypothetical protein
LKRWKEEELLLDLDKAMFFQVGLEPILDLQEKELAALAFYVEVIRIQVEVQSHYDQCQELIHLRIDQSQIFSPKI